MIYLASWAYAKCQKPTYCSLVGNNITPCDECEYLISPVFVVACFPGIRRVATSRFVGWTSASSRHESSPVLHQSSSRRFQGLVEVSWDVVWKNAVWLLSSGLKTCANATLNAERCLLAGGYDGASCCGMVINRFSSGYWYNWGFSKMGGYPKMNGFIMEHTI